MRKLLIAAGVALVATFACGESSPSTSGPNWLRTIHPRTDSDGPGSVAEYCDTETGNLLYTIGDYRGGIAVVPGGCK